MRLARLLLRLPRLLLRLLLRLARCFRSLPFRAAIVALLGAGLRCRLDGCWHRRGLAFRTAILAPVLAPIDTLRGCHGLRLRLHGRCGLRLLARGLPIFATIFAPLRALCGRNVATLELPFVAALCLRTRETLAYFTAAVGYGAAMLRVMLPAAAFRGHAAV